MRNLMETAASAGIATFMKAINVTDLVGKLSQKGPFTIFAPNDGAFAKIGSGGIEPLLKNPTKLTHILSYHILPGLYQSQDLGKTHAVKTIHGEKVSIEQAGGKIKVNGAAVVKADIRATNGVIHIIDKVIMPPK